MYTFIVFCACEIPVKPVKTLKAEEEPEFFVPHMYTIIHVNILKGQFSSSVVILFIFLSCPSDCLFGGLRRPAKPDVISHLISPHDAYGAMQSLTVLHVKCDI